MTDQPQKRRVGELRPSHVIHTFGVASIVDLPNFSAIVCGLDEWEPPTPKTEISEERLLGLVRTHLGPQVERLARPEVATSNDPFDPESKRGIPVRAFPGWMRCTFCDLIAPLNSGLFAFKEDLFRTDRNVYVHVNCPKANKATAVPVRFVRVCEEGHLDDFPWVQFVHGGPTKCPGPLRIREFGVSAEAADILVTCDECKQGRPMTMAFGDRAEATLGPCTGRHPHLRHFMKCEQSPTAALAGASNLWFPVTVSALSVPTNAGRLIQLVREHWPVLKPISSKEILFAFKAAGHLTKFAEFGDQELLSAIERYRGMEGKDLPQDTRELRIAEWQLFSDPEHAPEEADFQLTSVPAPTEYKKLIERVVLAERLRVVQALIGFTRIVSPGDFADPSEIPEIRRAPLARRAPVWVPASEVRGEGLFLQLSESAISRWVSAKAAKAREIEFARAHMTFRRARQIEHPEAHFPGIRYVLLHSLAHTLIRQFAIECGYSAASLRERIYSLPPEDQNGPMAGILIYTAAADSEGTLGGLVSLGQPQTLRRHLDHALEAVRLCASDPLCSEHRPGAGGVNLHGSACHACLFVSETSCERGNKYLDRTLLVETVGGEPVPFFERAEASVS